MYDRMFKCTGCGKTFTESEAESATICLEEENGVAGLFDDYTYSSIYVCPKCGCHDLEDYEEEEEEEYDE